MLRAVNARKALVLLSLVVLTAVGYIEDPRNEGTETDYQPITQRLS